MPRSDSRKETLIQATEQGFHERLKALLPPSPKDLLPLGDDCTAIAPGPGEVLLASTDSVAQGTHFPPGTPARLVGRLAAAVNLSDLAANGGRPEGLLSCLLLPPSTKRRWAEEVLLGMNETARAHGARVLGGDTKSSPVPIVVATALGWGRRGKLMPRSGARAGDLIAVTGTVGRGGALVTALDRGLGNRARVLQELLSVEPRCREGMVLRDFAHAAIDSSDGLAKSLRLIGSASGVGARVDEKRLPYHPAVGRVAGKISLAPSDLAFLGGDYELVLAIPPSRKSACERRVRRAGFPLHFIGEFTRSRTFRLEQDGDERPLPEVGWDSFASQS